MTNYGKEFYDMMEYWHANYDGVDEKLEAKIAQQFAEIYARGKDYTLYHRTYFRPSSANDCQRELYHRLRGDRKDPQTKKAYHGRWQRIGTKIGELLQTDILYIEKHFRKKTGNPPPFIPERTSEGYPAWEEFVWGCVEIEYKGHKFSIIGEPDGVLKHQDGKRIGLEIKSKQTTNAQTSKFSMRAPTEAHLKQSTAYAIMHDLDTYLIVYLNASKKSWNMSDEDYDKTPDMRVFEMMITDDMKTDLLDYWVEALEAVDANTPPPVDLSKWQFNDYKEIISETITEQEFVDLKAEARAIQASGVPVFIKNTYKAGIEFIESYRQRKGLTWDDE